MLLRIKSLPMIFNRWTTMNQIWVCTFTPVRIRTYHRDLRDLCAGYQVWITFHCNSSWWITLPGTNISHSKAVGKMNFLSHWWDMLVPWRVSGIKVPYFFQNLSDRQGCSLTLHLRCRCSLATWSNSLPPGVVGQLGAGCAHFSVVADFHGLLCP